MKAVVLVNGIPGSGKTTLSRALAAELGFPLLAKDTVKESLFDSLGILDRPWSQKIGLASIKVIWSLVQVMPGPVLIDNNVAPETRHFFAEDAKLAAVDRVIEVWCEIATDVAWERFLARVGTTRHPGHCDETNIAAGMGVWAPQNVPAGLGPLLRVPTDRPVDVITVATWVRDQLPNAPM